jgi:Death domain
VYQTSIADRHFSGLAVLSRRDMDGGKIEWIRKDLGLSWIEFHRELGISRMTLWRCRQEGAPKLIALAILGLWYSRKMGGLLDEPGEKETTASPRRAKNSKKKA